MITLLISLAIIGLSNIDRTTACKTKRWNHLFPENGFSSRSQCGIANPAKNWGKRVINGVSTAKNEFPWLVSIKLKAQPARRYGKRALNYKAIHRKLDELERSGPFSRDELKTFAESITGGKTPSQPSLLMCTGTLIGEQYVLTSYACHKQPINVESYTVVLGENNIREAGESGEVEVGVEKVILHPKGGGFANNIALVKLKKKVKFQKSVRPICLPVEGEDFGAGKICTAAGWGVTKLSPTKPTYPSSTLNKIDVTIIDKKTCTKQLAIWDKVDLLKPPSKDVFCIHEDDKDLCQGDGGVPIACISRDLKYVVKGLNSIGTGCSTNYPNLATNIVPYLDWIEEVTKA